MRQSAGRGGTAVTLALVRTRDRVATRPLDDIAATLVSIRGSAAAFGIADDLVLGPTTAGDGWRPATGLLAGDGVEPLLATPRLLWNAQPHAAAALAFKQYTYWLAMPAVLGWATARRVPLLDAGNVAVRHRDTAPHVTLGMLRPTVAVLPDDPAAGAPGTRVVADSAALLDTLCASLLDAHVTPLVAAVRDRVRIGAHTLYGQLAAAVCYALAAAGPAALLDEPTDAADRLLAALGLTGEAALTHAADGLAVRRNTCCLAFVTPGLRGRLCPDCCVSHHA